MSLRKLMLVAISIVAILVMFTPSFAMPVHSDTRTIQETNPINESSGNWNLDWSYVYNYKGCSSAAVGSRWILTAAHVADDSGTGVINVGGVDYTPVETRYYDGTALGTVNAGDATRDLALVRFHEELPGFYNIATNSNRYLGDDVIMVGFGNDGLVTQTETDGYWTEVAGRDKRWVTNNIDGLYTVNNTPYGSYSFYRTTISGTSHASNTDYEGGVNVYDSGGPMFALEGGEWVLAGVNTLRGTNGSGQFTSSYTVPVGDYDQWVTNVTATPEPGTIAVLGLGGLAVLIRRRKARRG